MKKFIKEQIQKDKEHFDFYLNRCKNESITMKQYHLVKMIEITKEIEDLERVYKLLCST